MTRSAWLRWAGAGIVALAAVGALASTTLGARDRTWDPPDCAGDAGGVPSRAEAGGVAAASGDRPWFRLDPYLDSSGALAGQRLAVGRADGRGRRTLDLGPESFAAGPFGTIVLAGTDDGSRSRLFALDVLAGCATAIDESADVIRRATVSPDGRSVVEFRVDRRSRADLGTWRRRLDVDAPVARIAPPIGGDGRFGRTWSTDFLWSAGGTELAIQSCGETACRTRVLDPASGVLHLIADPDLGPALGLADGRLIAYLACRGLPCPVVAIDVADGRRRLLASDAGTAVLIDSEAGPLLVHERVVGARATLRAVPLDSTPARDLGSAPDGLGLQSGGMSAAAGFAVPFGWILLAPEGRMPLTSGAPSPILRHVLDGRTAAVDEVTR